MVVQEISVGRARLMEMTWENLMMLFTWAAQQGSDPPLADRVGEAMVIDGRITREDFERFMASHATSEG
jgi:hypothetical protein